MVAPAAPADVAWSGIMDLRSAQLLLLIVFCPSSFCGSDSIVSLIWMTRVVVSPYSENVFRELHVANHQQTSALQFFQSV